MERKPLTQRLEQAERQVAEGLRHIQAQRQHIVALVPKGQETSHATYLLKTFEDLQQVNMAERDRLRKELAAGD